LTKMWSSVTLALAMCGCVAAFPRLCRTAQVQAAEVGLLQNGYIPRRKVLT